MQRILDEVRLGKFQVWPSVQGTWDFYVKAGVLDLNESVPIDITNVYKWVHEEWSDLDSNRDQRHRLWSLCEGMRPSFYSAWFEWRMSEIVTNKTINRSVKVDARAIWAFEVEDNNWSMILFERQDGDVLATYACTLDLDETECDFLALYFPPDESKEEVLKIKHFVAVVIAPVIVAQSLMHCKNVVVENQAPQKKRAKEFLRKHKMHLAKFNTVKIEPMKIVIRNAGGVHSIGTAKAMHIVRGHFAEYTEAKPLFGKVTGRFFRAQHLRGNADLGVKEPDYSVQAPKQ